MLLLLLQLLPLHGLQKERGIEKKRKCYGKEDAEREHQRVEGAKPGITLEPKFGLTSCDQELLSQIWISLVGHE